MEDAVFLACPTHDNRMDAQCARAFFSCASRKPRRMLPVFLPSSLISLACNSLLCEAINGREEHGFKWFAMLHSDIEPDNWWVDTLIEEAEKYDADIISAVTAIKDNRGLTSTALIARNSPRTPLARLTLRQVNHPDFPDTFDAAAACEAIGVAEVPGDPYAELLVNTGCMVVRLDRPWLDPNHVYFKCDDAIVWQGAWLAATLSEDWFFSRAAARGGAKVMATRKVKTIHKGGASYPSDHVWGQNIDTQCLAEHAQFNELVKADEKQKPLPEEAICGTA